ncbi:MAG: hypothetical protein HDR83_00915 [Bacteroides sp.]|nr:hypothetical protein [Bacteroides sp.]
MRYKAILLIAFTICYICNFCFSQGTSSENYKITENWFSGVLERRGVKDTINLYYFHTSELPFLHALFCFDLNSEHSLPKSENEDSCDTIHFYPSEQLGLSPERLRKGIVAETGRYTAYRNDVYRRNETLKGFIIQYQDESYFPNKMSCSKWIIHIDDRKQIIEENFRCIPDILAWMKTEFHGFDYEIEYNRDSLKRYIIQ